MLGGGQKVRVIPDKVALLGAHGVGGAAPQLGGGGYLRGAELDADDLGEGLLGRAAGGAAACPRLVECAGGGDALAHGLGDHVLDPAFHQRDQGFHAGGGVGVAGGDPRREIHALQLFHRLLDGLRVAGLQVELAGGLLDVRGVDLQAHRVFLDGGKQALHQPRDVLKQALPGGLAGGDVHQHVAGGDFQILSGCLHVRRQDRDNPGGRDRQAEVGAGEDLLGQIAQGVAELHAVVHAGHLVHHVRQWAHHLPGLFRQGIHLSLAHVLRHRGHQALPRRHGVA